MGLDVVRVADVLVGLTNEPPDRDAAEEAIAHARARNGDEPALVERSDDARALVRLLEAAIGGAGAPPSSRDAGTDGAVVVGPQLAWLRLPGGHTITLSDHDAARRIMLRLIEHHAERQEDGLPPEQLIAAGWPGEKLLAEAARNRLYVVVAWLRKQGLKELLLRRFGGYMLAPTVRVRRAPA